MTDFIKPSDRDLRARLTPEHLQDVDGSSEIGSVNECCPVRIQLRREGHGRTSIRGLKGARSNRKIMGHGDPGNIGAIRPVES